MFKLVLPLLIGFVQSITVERIPTTGTPPPRGLYQHCEYYNGNLYFFGRLDQSTIFYNDLHKFDLTTNVWSILQPIDGAAPMKRRLFAMYSTETLIVIHGGHGENGPLNDLWAWDNSQNTWQRLLQTGDIPPPFYRAGFTDFTHSGTRYFAVSSFATEDDYATDELYIYNTTTSTWQKMPKVAASGHSTPSERRMCSLHYYNNYIYLWGGEGMSDNGSDLYRYSMITEQWEQIPVSGVLPQTRSFHGSAIYNDFLYVFPGWVASEGRDEDTIWRFDLSQATSLGSNSVTWELLDMDRSTGYDKYMPGDAYAAALVGNQFYIHGGFSYFRPLGNFLIALNLDTTPVSLTEVSPDGDMPTARYFHTMTLISGKFYMYGGSTGINNLDELWIYDEIDGSWMLKDTIGEYPGPLMGHGAVAYGNNLLIWGGKNGNVFSSDLYMYNTLTNIWELVEVKSQLHPSGAEGVWIQIYNEDLYLYGGKNGFQAKDTLWKFNLGTYVYTLLSDKNYHSPKAVAYSTCYTVGSKMYIMEGIDDNTGSPNSIHEWDMDTNRWEINDMTLPEPLSNVASGKTGNSIIVVNGILYQNIVVNNLYSIQFDTNEITYLKKLDWGSYAEAAVYYKNSLYIFGGGGATRNDTPRLTIAVDRFYKINFPDYPCSIGTYSAGNECVPCPIGTYKDIEGDQTCTQCPTGTFNELLGSWSPKNCLPWPEGTYNAQLGQSFWLKCESEQECPTGTKFPKRSESQQNAYKDFQPPIFESKIDEAEEYTEYALFTVFALTMVVIVASILSQGFQRIVTLFDLYINMHDHIIGKAMIVKRTFIGGLFSVIGVAILFYLTAQTALYFLYDNIEETKALIPIVLLRQYTDSVKGDIDIQVDLNEYGGTCVDKDDNCVSEIGYTESNMSGKFSSISWEFEESTCRISLTINDWRLGTQSTIEFHSLETIAYAASIQITVSTQSSIPDEKSELTYLQTAPLEQVFTGPEPTDFHFYSIPSLYESEISDDSSKETGYLLTLGEDSQEGSSYTVENIAKTRFLHAKITFSSGESALYTRKVYKLRVDALLLGIIGGIAGVFEIVAIFMAATESRFEQWKENSKKQQEKNRMEVNHYLDEYFDPSESTSLAPIESQLVIEDYSITVKSPTSDRRWDDVRTTAMDADFTSIDAPPVSPQSASFSYLNGIKAPSLGTPENDDALNTMAFSRDNSQPYFKKVVRKDSDDSFS